jgi:hypothetical protein
MGQFGAGRVAKMGRVSAFLDVALCELPHSRDERVFSLTGARIDRPAIMTTRIAIAALFANAVLFACVAFRPAAATGEAGVLRARGLEIVDANGRVRASLALLHDDGDGVILRLIDAHGRPSVKLGTGNRGAALAVCGPSDPGCVVLSAEDRAPRLRFIAPDGRERVVAP